MTGTRSHCSLWPKIGNGPRESVISNEDMERISGLGRPKIRETAVAKLRIVSDGDCGHFGMSGFTAVLYTQFLVVHKSIIPWYTISIQL